MVQPARLTVAPSGRRSEDGGSTLQNTLLRGWKALQGVGGWLGRTPSGIAGTRGMAMEFMASDQFSSAARRARSSAATASRIGCA